MYKFHELRNRESGYFGIIKKYCREMFHCSARDIDSLVSKLLLGDTEKIKAHVLYTECLGELAGFVIFYYYPKNRVGFIDALVILENYRNQGIGSQLYWRMVDFLKDRYPECTGHILELCQEKDHYLKRKAFFLKLGCIPLDLDFFPLDPVIVQSSIQLLYHPYRLNLNYSLETMESIFMEMATDLLH
ncbi:GNAT family N-acetyltransferase [Phosphitispora fastidiosa]|uniref:GNAT family N-acetyltransferase n=1 Tax=Phosphitispora fastidiosa TaxID=2837202 RepID=UPI001E38D192|nr:GNAT family N-acetyltransferase [Phosphitispora fastidiosa]MBU7007687.1 GNAT superfamily N-acetyltransferase [Phosphitispora fastidiosa]